MRLIKKQQEVNNAQLDYLSNEIQNAVCDFKTPSLTARNSEARVNIALEIAAVSNNEGQMIDLTKNPREMTHRSANDHTEKADRSIVVV